MALKHVTPRGLLLAPSTVPRADWLRIRREGIGSSDVAAILGVAEHSTALHVWYDKTGQLDLDQDAGEAAMWGNLLEEPVAREWCRRNHSSVQRVGIVAHDAATWKRCTLDRKVDSCPMNMVDRCALEVKTRSAWVAGRWKRGLPEDVHAQVAWQMNVTGYDHIHLACLIGGQEFRQFTVHRDHDLEATINQIVTPFWTDNVMGEIAPGVDVAHPDDEVELANRVHPSRTGVIEVPFVALESFLAYQEAGALESAAKARKAGAKAKLVHALGGGDTATMDGHLMYTYLPTTRRSVDLDKLADEFPAAYEACVSENASPTIRLSAKFDAGSKRA